MIFTDSHAHLYSSRFDADRNETIERAISSGVKRSIVPSTSIENHQKTKELALAYPKTLFAAYGVHPTTVNECSNLVHEIDEVERYLSDREGLAVAVGECGLDLYHSQEFIDEQIYTFRAMAQMAICYDLPLIIHVRDSFELIHRELSRFQGRLSGVIHGFSGTLSDYQRIKQYGEFKFGIGGVLTFKNSKLKDVVAKMSLEDILLETDTPYLTPEPFRGSRNEPSHVTLISERIADIFKCDKEQISLQTELNCNQIFKKLTK